MGRISRERTGLQREGAREREEIDAGWGGLRGGFWGREGREGQRPRQKGTETQKREDERLRAGKGWGWGQREMQRRQSLAGSEVRVSVRSAAVQGWPGVLVPRVGGCKELRGPPA